MQSSTRNQTNEMKEPLLQDVISNDESSPRAHACALDSQDLILWVLLSILLFSQFAMAYHMHEEVTQFLSFTSACVNVLLFLATSWLYRHAYKDANCNNSERAMFLLLLPEIMVNITLVLTLCHKFALGFFVLLGGSLAFSAFALVVSVNTLLFDSNNDTTKEDEDVKPETSSSNEMAVCRIV